MARCGRGACSWLPATSSDGPDPRPRRRRGSKGPRSGRRSRGRQRAATIRCGRRRVTAFNRATRATCRVAASAGMGRREAPSGPRRAWGSMRPELTILALLTHPARDRVAGLEPRPLCDGPFDLVAIVELELYRDALRPLFVATSAAGSSSWRHSRRRLAVSAWGAQASSARYRYGSPCESSAPSWRLSGSPSSRTSSSPSRES